MIGAEAAGISALNVQSRLNIWYCSVKLWYSAVANRFAAVALFAPSCVACPTVLEAAHRPSACATKGPIDAVIAWAHVSKTAAYPVQQWLT